MAEKKTTTGIQAVQKWENAEFGSVRTVMQNEDPWFVATDIAKILGFKQANDMTKRLDEDEKGRTISPTLRGNQKVQIINESGLYHAIFMSRKDEAKSFRRWVTNDVLPAIRRTGNYTASPVVNLRDMAVTLQKVSERVSALEQNTVKRFAAIPVCQPVTSDIADFTTELVGSREKVVSLVKKVAEENGMSAREVWTDLYRGYEKASGIPLFKCAKALDISIISFVDMIRRMESFKKFAEQVLWFV